MLFLHDAPAWIIATDGGLRAYRADWNLLDVVPGRYARVSTIEAAGVRILAIANLGVVECLDMA